MALSLMLSGPARADFDPDEDRAIRITSEAAFGILGGAAGAFTGGLIGGGICLAVDGGGNFACLVPAFVGALTGQFIGMGLGTYLGGELVDGNGGLGWTYLGQTGGAALAAVIVSAAEVDVGDVSWWLLTIGLPLAGAVLGYELSTHSDAPGPVSGALGFSF
jgi:hypothetical protein